MTKKQLNDWINKIGGRSKAAAYLDVNPATVWRWMQNPERIKKATAMAIRSQLEE